MGSWSHVSPELLFPLCFVLSIVSALLPWMNGEVLLLSCTAPARSPLDLAVMVLLASAGQMTGKCGLYWAGRGAVKLQSRQIKAVVDKWQDRFRRSQDRSMTLVFVSSALGIPPFYVVTILAGAFRLKFVQFISVGTCGRLVRFGLLVSIPQLALRVIGAHH